MRELSRRGLLGPEDGWSLAPVGAWLMLEGRHIVGPVALLEALAGRLDAAGARLDRLGFTVATIHPQILAWGCYWTRRDGAREFAGRHGVQNSDAYRGSPVQFVQEQKRSFRRRLVDLEEERDHAMLHELRAEGMTDYVALPMVFGSGTVNFLTVATAAPEGFYDDDLDRFTAFANLLAPLVEILHVRRMTLGLLDAFVGPRISARILDGQVKRGDGDRIEAAFWYSDLRGFTALSESLPAGQLLQLLNDYFENCAAAAAARGGEILQFIGDAILIVFEIRRPEDEAEVCNAALDAAIDAFDSIAVVNHRRRRAGLPQIEFGLGLHVGSVTHANVGSPNRLAFNVVGPAVNKTARIQSLTKEAGVPLLLSEEFAAFIRRPLRSLGQFELRGVAGAHAVLTLCNDDPGPAS
ncbi:MAG: adenylate/guanylate cyclase domain-containing protein [Betaproteobacteria bacterium]|nr:adenylate/guanylate cyclase domain-containing protein [Betaproteobacteria bacterium]